MKKNKDIQKLDQAYIVKSHDVRIDDEYVRWIAELKHRYRSAQVKAAVKVNTEKLLFNWQLGRDLVHKKAEERWGTGVVEQLSLDLKREFPNDNGFSTTNLWYMKKWYLFYNGENDSEKPQRLVAELQRIENQNVKKLHQLGAEFGAEKLHQAGGEFAEQKLQRVVGEFPTLLSFVPWRHHVEIISKCKSIDEAIFYINKTIEQGLSRDALINCIKSNLYEHQGKVINNFDNNLPEVQSKLVQEVLKENYNFSFATVSNDLYDEEELEEALSKNITDLLLEMGSGFAFLGRQRQLVVCGRTRKIDLLFYHIRLRCYIVCELKAKQFEPEFAGKLNFYVNAVDELMKTEDDNPTIGLLICSNTNKTEVKWSFKGINTPIGVATYNNIRIKDVLPSQEQLEERMKLIQNKVNR